MTTEAIKPKARFYPEKSIPNYRIKHQEVCKGDLNATKTLAKEFAKAITSGEYDISRLLGEIYFGDSLQTSNFLKELVLAQHELHTNPEAGEIAESVAPEITGITGETAQALELAQENDPMKALRSILDSSDEEKVKQEKVQEVFRKASNPEKLVREIFTGTLMADNLRDLMWEKKYGETYAVKLAENLIVVLKSEKNIDGILKTAEYGPSYISGTTITGQSYFYQRISH